MLLGLACSGYILISLVCADLASQIHHPDVRYSSLLRLQLGRNLLFKCPSRPPRRIGLTMKDGHTMDVYV
jgi:hypothetical protein